MMLLELILIAFIPEIMMVALPVIIVAKGAVFLFKLVSEIFELIVDSLTTPVLKSEHYLKKKRINKKKGSPKESISAPLDPEQEYIIRYYLNN